jgi:hypothetical protein
MTSLADDSSAGQQQQQQQQQQGNGMFKSGIWDRAI